MIRKKKLIFLILVLSASLTVLLYDERVKWDIVWFIRKTIWLTSLQSSRNFNFDPRKFPHLDASTCPPSGMIMSVRSIGRLGNQMSEYASLWVLARIHHRYPIIPDDMKFFLLQYFGNFSLKSFSELRFLIDCDFKWGNFYLEQATHRDELEAAVNDPSYALEKVAVYLDGYPDSIPLYGLYYEELVDEFSFHPRHIHSAQDQFKAFTASRTNSVFVMVHVRRTDYIGVLKKFHNGTKFIDKHYFDKALGYFRDKYPGCVFLVFSDDIDWCRSNVTPLGDDVIYRDNGDVFNPVIDLLMMMSCHHAVLTHGTFGFWAAFLGPHRRGGEVVVASNFTPIPTPLEELVPTTPFLRERWKTMSV